MDFNEAEKINYDPHQMISQRRTHNRNKSFGHQVVEGWDKIANLLSFDQSEEEIKKINMNQANNLALSVQTLVKYDIANKITISEVTSMEVDEQISSKRTKTKNIRKFLV